MAGFLGDRLLVVYHIRILMYFCAPHDAFVALLSEGLHGHLVIFGRLVGRSIQASIFLLLEIGVVCMATCRLPSCDHIDRPFRQTKNHNNIELRQLTKQKADMQCINL